MAKTPTEIKSLARQHTERALQVLQGCMDASDAPWPSRVAAAVAMLDRGWGKPDSKHELHVIRKRASEMTNDELAAIAAGSSEGTAEAPIDPSQLN